MLRYSLLIGLLILTIGANGTRYKYYPEVKQYYKFYTSPKTWVDARDFCRQEDASLALPSNEAEADVLKRIFAENPPNSIPTGVNPNYFFLNFHDMFREGEFVTDIGVALQYYFVKWDANQPDNYFGNENCGSFLRGGTLNDVPCYSPALFVCQKNKPEILNPDSRCRTTDSQYKYFDVTKNCYKLHLNPRTWLEARAVCQAEGGNLAIINSHEEANYLVGMFNISDDKVINVNLKNYILLGFHDIYREGRFITVKGKDLQSTGYTNWTLNEPNNSGGIENCGSMNRIGGLNDYPCNLPSLFFCEIDGKPRKRPNKNDRDEHDDDDKGKRKSR